MTLKQVTRIWQAMGCAALFLLVTAGGTAKAQFKSLQQGASNLGGSISKSYKNVQRGTNKAIDRTKRSIGSATNSVKRAGGNISSNAKRAGGSVSREMKRGTSSAGRTLSNQGKPLGKVNMNRLNPLGSVPRPTAQSFNRNLGGVNLRPSTPSFPKTNFQNPFQNGGAQIRNQTNNLMRSPRQVVEQTVRNPVVQRVQQQANQNNVMIQRAAKSLANGEGSSSSGSSLLPGAVTNFSKNVANAPSGLVKITRQTTSSASESLKQVERNARDAGGAFAEQTKKAARDGAKGAVDVRRATTRTTADIFSGGGQILGGVRDQGVQAVATVGAAAEDTLAETGETLINAAEDGAELYQQGKAKAEEAQAIYEEGKQRYKQARDAYDKLKNGDREDALEVFEDVSGIEVEGEVRKKLLETDLVDAVEVAEDVTGIDMENVKQRVEQGQALVDAARSGKLSKVEEAAGEKSNRNEVQAEKSEGWNGVAWGNEIDHEEYAKMAGAIGASGVAGNSGPFMVYAENWATEQYATLSESLLKQGKSELAKKLNKQMLMDALQNAMDGKPATLPIKGATIDVGLATYNHSLELSAGVPEITSRGVEITQQGATTKLPNTHQPYVRFKFEE